VATGDALYISWTSLRGFINILSFSHVTWQSNLTDLNQNLSNMAFRPILIDTVSFKEEIRPRYLPDQLPSLVQYYILHCSALRHASNKARLSNCSRLRQCRYPFVILNEYRSKRLTVVNPVSMSRACAETGKVLIEVDKEHLGTDWVPASSEIHDG
jgi:hypothetical protein